MNDWTPAEEALLLGLVQQGMLPNKIANYFNSKKIDRSFQAIRRKIQREKSIDPYSWHAMVDVSPTERFDKEITVTTDKMLLLFDIHAPFHDHRWINQLIGIGVKRGIETVGIGGDLVDFIAFSKWGRQDRVEAEDEIRAAEQIVSTLASEFKTVIYSGGNHENRLPRKTDNLLSLQSAMEMFVRADNVQITDYHYFIVKSGDRTWSIEHPKNASVNATIVPKRLAAKYQMDVAAGHGHLWGIARDDTDRFWAVDVGICSDPDKLAYDAKVHNIRPRMQRGSLIIEYGDPILLHPDNVRMWL